MPLAEGFPSQCSYSVLTLNAPEETLLPDLVGKAVMEETIYLQNLVCLYPTNLHGRTLRLARLRELQSALHWSVIMISYKPLSRHKLSPYSRAGLDCCCVYLHVGNCILEGFWAIWAVMELDPGPVPWLQA